MSRAAAGARLADLDAFRASFARQPYPEDFEAEVARRTAIAVAAADLAWGDLQQTPMPSR